jgi:hypothetical protein
MNSRTTNSKQLTKKQTNMTQLVTNDSSSKMNMLSTYGTRSRLGKLLNSLKSYLLMETDRADVFLESVRSLMLDTFVDDEDERTQTGLPSNEPASPAASVEPTAHLADRIPTPTSQ